MGAAKKSKGRTVVGASFNDDELIELDRQRARLGTNGSGQPKHSRAGALKLLWETFGDEAVDAVKRREDLAAATERTVAPLADALDRASAVWQERAHQRQVIGANANQITRLANTLLLRLREGRDVPEDALDDIALALQGIERRLGEQEAAEHDDDHVLADARRLLDSMRTEP